MLRKEPMGKEVGEEDAFVFNEAFSSKFYKVKVGTISAAKESEPEKAETRHKVEEDRKPQVPVCPRCWCLSMDVPHSSVRLLSELMHSCTRHASRKQCCALSLVLQTVAICDAPSGATKCIF